ncbi:MAG: sigma factor-like helix-turn-helix DNA-binding protein [Planctomycetota bacterium]|jgi:hypothetical protein
MGLEELSRYIAKECERIQADLKDPGTDMGAQSESSLSRIEKQVSEIRGHTRELIERVPENLSPLLIGIKESVLEIMSSSWKQQSAERAKPASPRGNWIMDTLQKLTPQEKKLFKLCFQNGLITYEDLAERLGISLITTRGIVNRLFQDVDKRRLFCKKRRDGFINVGLTEAAERETHRKYENGLDKNEKFSRILNKAYRPKGLDSL